MNLPPRFVQGFVDEIERQKLAKRQMGPPTPVGHTVYPPTGAGPSGMIGQPGGGATGRPPMGPTFVPRPATRPTPLPDYVVASGGSYVPPSQRPMPADHRMDEIERRRAAILEAPIGVVPEGALGPSYQPGMIQVPETPPIVTPMQTRTLEQGPGMAGSTVDPFVTEQNTRAVVATYQGTRIGEELGVLATENQAARARLSANTAELQQITANAQQPGHQSTTAELEREQLLETQIAADQATLDQNAAESRDLGSGSPILGTLMGIVSAPGEWGGGIAGDLGYWYANNIDDPSAAAAVVGFIAESPIGAVLSADGVGATDYLRWIKDHPTEVAHVQANGYTNEQGQQFTGGDALYNYYLSSQGIVGSVITQAIVDPTSYVGLTGILGRRLAGTTATRFLPEGAVGRRTAVGLLDESIPPAAAAEMGVTASTPVNIAREPVGQAVRRNVGGIVMGPQTLLDEAADRAVGGVGRAIGSLVPDSWLATPVAQQVAGVVNQIDNVFRNRNTARQQLAAGETSARPGVGPIVEDATGTATSASNVPYDRSGPAPVGITITDEEMLNPELALQQRNDLIRRSNQAHLDGDTETAIFLGQEIARLDARASYPVTIPPPPPPTRGINVPSQLPTNETPALPMSPYPGDTVMTPEGTDPQWYPGQPFRSAPDRPYSPLDQDPNAQAATDRRREILVTQREQAYYADDTEMVNAIDQEIARLDNPESGLPPPTSRVVIPSQIPAEEGLALPTGPLPSARDRLVQDLADASAYASETGDYSMADIIARQIDDLDRAAEMDYDITTNPPTSSVPEDVAPAPDADAGIQSVPVVRDRDSPDIFVGGEADDIRVQTITVVNPRSGTSNRYIVTGPPTTPRGPRVQLDETEFTSQRDAITRARTLYLGGEDVPPVAATSPVDADVIPAEDIPTYQQNPDGTWSAVVDGEDLLGESFPNLYEARKAVADLDAEPDVEDVVDVAPPAGQAEPEPTATTATDQKFHWRDRPTDNTMVTAIVKKQKDFIKRGVKDRVDRWFSWLDDAIGRREARDIERAEALGLDPTTQRAQTPPGQSVMDRAEDELAFIQMVGEPPPAQRLSNNDTFPSQFERAALGSENQSRQARRWLHQRGNSPVDDTFVVDPAYPGGLVSTYEDVTDYVDWLRQRRRDAIAAGPDLRMHGLGGGPNLRSFAERSAQSRLARRMARSRLRSARAAAAARRRAPLPPGATREPILSDAENRLLDTRISDLGRVGRSDVTNDGKTVVRGRDAGDTATVRSVYDPAHDNAIARGLTEEEAHQEGMKAVASRINADFGITTDAAGNALMRGIDTYTNYITMMARYGTPIAGVRSIQTDMVGDFVQAFLTEGPVTATEMILRTAGYVGRGFNWADTRLGEIAEKWGFDVSGLAPRRGIVESEIAGVAGKKSAVRKVFAPKFGKVNFDVKANPGTWIAKGAEVFRGLNDQMEMGRRTGLKGSIVDSILMREKKTFAQKAGAHRRLAGVTITDDDLAATVADLGTRFSPEDIRLAMERLANAKGATAKNAANFGERIGKDWANIRNTAAENAKIRVNKALFSYEFTNADEVIRRFIPFHYWSSRAVPFYIETAIRNPAFALSYYRMAEGLSERAEAEGWPDSLRFMVKIWTGPMGYMFFADPFANMGLLGVTEMLFPNDFDDGQTSSVGRWLQTISGRGGVGVTPAITALMAYSGLLGDDSYALDPSGTRNVRNLTGALMQLYAGTVGDQTLLGSPVEEALVRGRAYTSKWASKWIPGAREIPTSDQDAYPKQQIRNGMIDLRMQERGYTDESQMTESDWEVINTEFETQEGPLYEDAVANYSWANFAGQVPFRTLSGPISVRQEGQFNRANRDRRTPPGGAYAEPGQEPTAAQAYESYANLNGKYGRTAGGLSLPEYDPYNDNILTEGEKQFMRLWQSETGEAYTSGDLETLREGREYTKTMSTTTPGAAPYVAGEMGYYNLGEESASPLIDQYYKIMFADADVGMVEISGREWGPKRLAALTSDERETLANAWLTERDTTGSARETLKMRETWADAHPEYAAFKAWAKEIRSAYEGDIGAYRNALIAGNPNAARYFENAARAARETVNGRVNPSGINPETKRREGGTGGTATTEAYYAELDRRTLNLDAYLAINGIQRTLDDPRPLSTGDASATPGPFDPRPAGWSADGGGSGGQSSGGAGAPGTDDSRSRSRETWAAETIAATEAGVAQANALLTQQMGYPVDLMDQPSGILDAALAMLPPGLIPEDAWLYFDYLAWQAHQRLGNGPTDLLSYLAATSNGREWKSQRTTSYAGGAELVGATPATTYYPGQDSTQSAAPSNIPGGSYAAYLAGA